MPRNVDIFKNPLKPQDSLTDTKIECIIIIIIIDHFKVQEGFL